MNDLPDSLLEFHYNFLFAQEVLTKMNIVFQKQCQGCFVHSLSQRDHACMLLDTREQLEIYFFDIELSVNKEDCLRKWLSCVQLYKNVNTDLVKSYQDKFGECTIYTNKTWKNKVINMILRLRQLEKRFI